MTAAVPEPCFGFGTVFFALMPRKEKSCSCLAISGKYSTDIKTLVGTVGDSAGAGLNRIQMHSNDKCQYFFMKMPENIDIYILL